MSSPATPSPQSPPLIPSEAPAERRLERSLDQGLRQSVADALLTPFELCGRRMCRRSGHCLFYDAETGLPDCIRRVEGAQRTAYDALYQDALNVFSLVMNATPERKGEPVFDETEIGKRNRTALCLLDDFLMVPKNRNRRVYQARPGNRIPKAAASPVEAGA